MKNETKLIDYGDISNRAAKEAIAEKVAQRANKGDLIGAGSGSTAYLVVLAIAKRNVEENLDVVVVPTSIEIDLVARQLGLQVSVSPPGLVDWCFDGADEVDGDGRLIKGRGGALYRERVVFNASQKRLVVADESKTVSRLGTNFAVPVEVEPAWVRSAHDAIAKMGHVEEVNLRAAVNKDGPVITEYGRVLLDVKMSQIDADDEAGLLKVAGVVATGVFSGYEFERILN